MGTFGKLIRRHESGEPARCPRCAAYKQADDIEHDDSGQGFFESTVCGACGWRSESTYTSWHDDLMGTDDQDIDQLRPTATWSFPHVNPRPPEQKVILESLIIGDVDLIILASVPRCHSACHVVNTTEPNAAGYR
jgi:hypothetical protein